MEAPPIAEEDRHREPRVGLVYDERMLRHATPDGEDHPECRERIEAIWQELESAGVTQRSLLSPIFGSKIPDNTPKYPAIEVIHGQMSGIFMENLK